MDWKSEEGRRLLRAAYPSGVLDAEGVKGLNGLRRLSMTWARESPGWDGPMLCGPDYPEDLRSGGLLPDPTDLATWALMKHELLQQTEFWGVVEQTGWDPAPSMGWCRFGPDDQWFGFVVLQDSEDGSTVIQAVTPYYDFDTDDLRVALVMARAAMREVADG